MITMKFCLTYRIVHAKVLLIMLLSSVSCFDYNKFAKSKDLIDLPK